jgi:drug/metabolite transporter (DMT)-like permease
MLVAGELIVAVIIVRVWSGRPLSRASWAAALTVALAVAAFLVVTAPGHHHLAGHPDYNVAAAVGAALSGGSALVAAAFGLRATGRSRAVLLAVAAGLADTCSAVVTMAFSYVAGHGPAALFTSWTVYAVAVCGAGNVLLTQTAYQAGRPMVTLPVIAAVTPVTSVAIGIGLLGETPRTGVAGAVAASLAVVVASVALACLARSAPHAEPQTPRAKPQTPRTVPLARLAGPRVSPAEHEGVTISPSLAIRLRADRRMLPAHSRDDRP